MIYEVTVRERVMRVAITASGRGWAIRLDDGPERVFTGGSIGAAEWLLREGPDTHRIGLCLEGDDAKLQLDGTFVAAHVVDPRKSMFDLGEAGDQGKLATQMPGVVVRVLVSVGDAVTKGDVLLVVEAMKMENEFRAPMDGVVAEVAVSAGQTVDTGELLVRIEEPA